MAYVTPNSTIQYFDDLGLSPGYNDSLYFETPQAKNAYFDNLWFAQEEYTSYVYRNGKIRSGLPMSRLYTTAYIRFRNTSYENKWFYAFVTAVDYTNNGLVEISFEIDVVMTWMGTFELKKCFVERQHTLGDGIGDNIAEEGLETGDYKYISLQKSGTMQDMSIVVLSTVENDSSHTPAQGEIIGNIYNGCALLKFRTAEAVNNFINGLTDDQKESAIISIGMIPESYASAISVNHHEVVISKPYTTIDGYTPKNNKLFIYPYNVLSVNNTEGNYAEFRYEFFSGNSAYFTMEGVLAAQPEVICTPVFYKGVNGKNYNEKITMSGFPSCAYAVDTYRAYLAQNKSNLAIQALSSQGSGDLRAMAELSQIGSLLPGVGSIFNTANSMLSKQYNYSQKPPQAGGSQGADILTALGEKDFIFAQKQITANYAKMIDDYFTAFGYAVREVREPLMNARPFWTYVKTNGCVVHGNVPAADARIIEQAFDKGIRFWTNHANIGNYELDNSPA